MISIKRIIHCMKYDYIIYIKKILHVHNIRTLYQSNKITQWVFIHYVFFSYLFFGKFVLSLIVRLALLSND